MRMAIMGAGSLGTIIGALLSKNGYDVDLIKRSKKDVEIFNTKGATITGLMELVQPVKALTPDQMTGEYDIIFYLTKTTHNESALKPCKEHLKSDGVLVCMQNGLPEDAVMEIIGKERVVGCVVGWGATYEAPGVSRLTSNPDHMTYELGELTGQITPRIRMIEEILNHAGHVNVHTNFLGIRWTKLTSNSMFSGMSAVVGGCFGDVLDHPKAIKCSAHILNESVAVAKAAGVEPVPFQGDDILKLTFKSEKELAEKMPGIRKIAEAHRNIRTQMLYDIEAGRSTEIDTFNGIFVKWGKKYGVPTPVNEQVVQIVKAMSEGKYKIGPENVDRIQLPELPAE